MTKRIEELTRFITFAEVIADVGCDHGYISEAILKSGKANKVIASDISKECLKKAEKLLYPYITCKKAQTVVANGLEKTVANAAVIAGMGGAEIVDILQNAPVMPEKLYLQPMKNSEKVRNYLCLNGFTIIEDFTFGGNLYSGKYYDYIIAEKGLVNKVGAQDEKETFYSEPYDEKEILFGRGNLKTFPQAFISKLEVELETLELAVNKATLKTANELRERIGLIKGVLDDCKRREKNN